jgi:hypothetical protein
MAHWDTSFEGANDMLKATGTIVLLFTFYSCAPGAVYIDEEFGNSVKHNIAVQTINPEGVEQDDSQLTDGQQAQQAIERYRQGPAEADIRSLLGSGLN